MNARKAVSPVVASIILIGVGLLLGLFVSGLYSEIAYSYVKVEAMEYAYIYTTRKADVDNAWCKVVLYVVNRGTQSMQLTNVYVNDREVDVYGLVHGDSLLNSSFIGTSLPGDGLSLSAGEGVELFIWIGEKLFSPNTNLDISMNQINNVRQYKAVVIY